MPLRFPAHRPPVISPSMYVARVHATERHCLGDVRCAVSCSNFRCCNFMRKSKLNRKERILIRDIWTSRSWNRMSFTLINYRNLPEYFQQQEEVRDHDPLCTCRCMLVSHFLVLLKLLEGCSTTCNLAMRPSKDINAD